MGLGFSLSVSERDLDPGKIETGFPLVLGAIFTLND
jgi:hypothetical protein